MAYIPPTAGNLHESVFKGQGALQKAVTHADAVYAASGVDVVVLALGVLDLKGEEFREYFVSTPEDMLPLQQSMLANKSPNARARGHATCYAVAREGVSYAHMGVDVDCKNCPVTEEALFRGVVEGFDAAGYAAHALLGLPRLQLAAATTSTRPGRVSYHLYFRFVDAAGAPVAAADVGDLARYFFLVMYVNGVVASSDAPGGEFDDGHGGKLLEAVRARGLTAARARLVVQYADTAIAHRRALFRLIYHHKAGAKHVAELVDAQTTLVRAAMEGSHVDTSHMLARDCDPAHALDVGVLVAPRGANNEIPVFRVGVVAACPACPVGFNSAMVTTNPSYPQPAFPIDGRDGFLFCGFAAKGAHAVEGEGEGGFNWHSPHLLEAYARGVSTNHPTMSKRAHGPRPSLSAGGGGGLPSKVWGEIQPYVEAMVDGLFGFGEESVTYQRHELLPNSQHGGWTLAITLCEKWCARWKVAQSTGIGRPDKPPGVAAEHGQCARLWVDVDAAGHVGVKLGCWSSKHVDASGNKLPPVCCPLPNATRTAALLRPSAPSVPVSSAAAEPKEEEEEEEEGPPRTPPEMRAIVGDADSDSDGPVRRRKRRHAQSSEEEEEEGEGTFARLRQAESGDEEKEEETFARPRQAESSADDDDDGDAPASQAAGAKMHVSSARGADGAKVMLINDTPGRRYVDRMEIEKRDNIDDHCDGDSDGDGDGDENASFVDSDDDDDSDLSGDDDREFDCVLADGRETLGGANVDPPHFTNLLFYVLAVEALRWDDVPPMALDAAVVLMKTLVVDGVDRAPHPVSTVRSVRVAVTKLAAGIEEAIEACPKRVVFTAVDAPSPNDITREECADLAGRSAVEHVRKAISPFVGMAYSGEVEEGEAVTRFKSLVAKFTPDAVRHPALESLCPRLRARAHPLAHFAPWASQLSAREGKIEWAKRQKERKKEQDTAALSRFLQQRQQQKQLPPSNAPTSSGAANKAAWERAEAAESPPPPPPRPSDAAAKKPPPAKKAKKALSAPTGVASLMAYFSKK